MPCLLTPRLCLASACAEGTLVLLVDSRGRSEAVPLETPWQLRWLECRVAGPGVELGVPQWDYLAQSQNCWIQILAMPLSS